jgi:carbon monoxide dehydrogenase subunit G
VKLSATRDIARPAALVFAFLSDSSNNPLWQKGQVSCVWTSPPPISVGSTYEQEARFLGRRVASTFEVVEHEPGRSITIQTTAGSFPIRVHRRVEPIDDTTCRVTADISGEPRGFFRLAGRVLERLAQRSVDADYDRLTRLLDAGRA